MNEPSLSEKHFTVKELAQILAMSPAAVRRLYANEPGVLRFGAERRGHTRDYVTLRIPASVAERVYRRCMCSGLALPQPARIPAPDNRTSHRALPMLRSTTPAAGTPRSAAGGPPQRADNAVR